MAQWCAVVALLALMVCATESQSRFPRQYFGGKPEKPRPFEPATYLPPTGYPPAGSRPTPSYNEGPSSSTSYQPSQPSPTQNAPYPPASQPDQPYEPQPSQPGYSTSQPDYQPNQPGYQPNQPGYQPNQPGYEPSQSGYPTSQPTQPTYQPTYSSSQPYEPDYEPSPSNPSYQPSLPPQSSTYQPGPPSSTSYRPTSSSYRPTSSSYRPTQSSYQPTQSSYQPTQSSYQPTQSSYGTQPTSSSYTPQPSPDGRPAPIPDDDEDRHPPHIHAITVDCGKEMMTINIEFNKVYNGLIYSQDHYTDPACVYVRENSNQVKFSFTVSLNTCGTRFFSDFENEGQAYLENVLVLQNEAGIQEVWDHIRRVRCLWEGNLTKQLVSSLSVGMLNQITSNFSGDTAMARLDIQTGKGPFAPEANGLVKIGETMTLVVTVTGDAGFDIFVRECVARDSQGNQQVPLTDSNGCVLKPKLFGAFQKTRDTRNSGASVIAYAYFNAFKFPDEMDLVIQCDVELCKTDCDACPNPGSLEPKRRRRDVIHIGNRTVEPATTISKGLRVVFAEDLPEPAGFCMSPAAALWGGMLVFLASLMSSVFVSFCWMRARALAKFS